MKKNTKNFRQRFAKIVAIAVIVIAVSSLFIPAQTPEQLQPLPSQDDHFFEQLQLIRDTLFPQLDSALQHLLETINQNQ